MAVEEGVGALVSDAPSPRPSWASRLSEYFKKRPFKATEAEVGIDLKFIKASLKGSLKQDPTFRSKLQTHLSGLTYEFHQEFRGYLTDLLSWFRENRVQRKGVVFIFDGVDHIRGTFGLRDKVQHSVETLFSQFSEMLRLPGLHTVYTVPTYLPFLNPGLKSLYGMASLQVLPMTKQHRPEPERGPDEKGVEALRDFLQRRIAEPERLLGPAWVDSLDEMIAASGGYLRDLLAMVRSVAEAAFVARNLPAPASATKRAIQDLTNDYRRAVTAEDAEVLSAVAETFSIDHVSQDYRLRLADLFETHSTRRGPTSGSSRRPRPKRRDSWSPGWSRSLTTRARDARRNEARRRSPWSSGRRWPRSSGRRRGGRSARCSTSAASGSATPGRTR